MATEHARGLQATEDIISPSSTVIVDFVLSRRELGVKHSQAVVFLQSRFDELVIKTRNEIHALDEQIN